ncbi:MAG TPA: hypothetical protein PLS05_01735 [Clostridia bacterium]|jgi:hypothetical protein|nr:hypothetical protein [Clostridia bacterium]HOL60585.1 hypothetical protein [Clostridia bacterium]HPO52992.1 hypothetical protein [Clostridia bacterium]
MKKKKNQVPKEALIRREIDRANRIMSLKDSNVRSELYPPDNPNK